MDTFGPSSFAAWWCYWDTVSSKPVRYAESCERVSVRQERSEGYPSCPVGECVASVAYIRESQLLCKKSESAAGKEDKLRADE
ncbi:Hypothetical predicted protein [Cloeon dipterum]|uniref:Uncharacterized protein n=1 Tax=Cloeon dipterum TaxID=197152 RepID=A0A8S1DX37_9INSE|nr:Hypothetical predicted protein [Cloeon dipterum]